jgi:hypothetical protein
MLHPVDESGDLNDEPSRFIPTTLKHSLIGLIDLTHFLIKLLGIIGFSTSPEMRRNLFQ